MSTPRPSLPLQPRPVNNHRKRARVADDDEVQIVAVKKPKEASPGLLAFLRDSFSAMADWVKQRGAAFKNNFYTVTGEDVGDAANGNEDVAMAKEGRSGAGADISASNGHGGAGVRLSVPNFGRRPLHQGLSDQGWATRPKRESLFKSVPGRSFANGGLESRFIPRRSLLGASRERKDANLTVRNCIRLEERERYRQLLQHYAPSASLGLAPQQQLQPRFLDTRPTSKPEVSLLGTQLTSTHPKPGASSSRTRDAVVTVTPSVKPYTFRQPFCDLDVPLGSILRHQQWKREQAETKAPALDDPSIILVSDNLPASPGQTEVAAEGGQALSKAAQWKRSVDYFVGDGFKKLNLSDEEDKVRKRLIEETERELQEFEARHKEVERKLDLQIQKSLRLCARERPILEESEEFSEEEEEEDEPEEEAEALPELTEEMMNIVNRAFNPGPSNEVLVEGFRLQIKRCDIATLRGLSWLNDEVINFYMNLLMERGEQEGRPKVYAFNTFFYPKLTQDGFSTVRRWTRRVDLFAMDYVIVPVHLGMHWCLAIISMKHKTIRYFDSMGGSNRTCLQALERYLRDESLDKRKTPLDTSDWTLECVKDIPQQMNGSDCGMFACKFADYVTREMPITFSQQDMPYFRQRMVFEILTKKLLQ